MLGQGNPYEAPQAQAVEKRHFLYGAFRDNRGLLKVNLVLLGLVALAEGFNVWLEARYLAFMDGSLEFTEESYGEYESVYGLFSQGYTVLVVASTVMFFVWLNRTCKNAWMMDREGRDMRITPGWAVGWYFVPVAFWWMPVRSMREIVNASFGRHALGLLVPLWWAVSVIEGLCGIVYAQLDFDTLEQIASGFQFEVGFSIVSVVQVFSEGLLMLMVTRQQMAVRDEF